MIFFVLHVPYFVCPIEYSTELEQMTMSCEPSLLFRQQVFFSAQSLFSISDSMSLLILGMALAFPNFAHLGAPAHKQRDPGHLSLLHPRLLDVPLCLHHRSLWRFLCLWLQEGLQDQGLWRHYTWTWWNYGQVQTFLASRIDSYPILRFDCQFLMATFVNVYIHSFINLPTPGKIIQQVFLLLPEEQLELFRELEASLLQRGILQP